ncbi:LamG-like jellyroll fold domain-containing protein [Isoptericola sp. NPDC056573]|uniref:LamG-like jellyroll fold domain-containing protein n=1 Tax=Isoptericola sp. NPDC056573 TaxID=3345868 RepID=UPI00369F956E
MVRRRQLLATLALAGLVLTGGATTATASPGAAPQLETTEVPSGQVVLESGPLAWTALRSGAPTSTAGFGFDGDRVVGQCVGEGGRGCPARGVQRVAYDFGDLGDPAALADGVLVAATLSLPVGRDQACGIDDVRVHAVPAVTVATTWSASTPGWRSTGADLSGAGCGGDRRVDVDVTRAVGQAVRSGGPLAFGLAAADEDCRGCGRAAFGPDATLTVELRATDTVVALGTVRPETSCAAGDDRPAVRSTTPTLVAELSNAREPFPSSMSAEFAVRDLATGDELWRSVPTTPRVSGVTHSVKVPDGVLAEGGTYGWTAQAVLPSGDVTEPVGCELTVDVTAPGETVVTPVEGYPAVYLEDGTAGGVGMTGGFRFDVPGSDDVAYVQYSTVGDALFDRAQPGEVVELTPSYAGPTVLYAQAVDAAGNVGPRREYRFVVAYPVARGATWWFDELAGTTAGSTLGGGNALNLSGTDLWSPGPWGVPGDGALTFDADSDVAATDGAVVDAAGNVTVAAFVRPDADGATASVVTQGEDGRPGFTLGTVADDSCTSATGTCWAFSVATGDGGTSTTAVSGVAPEPGSWVFLAGMRNAATGAVDLWTCSLTGMGAPVRSGRAQAGPLTAAPSGPITVGGGAWRGAVDGVRVLDSVQDESKIRRWCFGAM